MKITNILWAGIEIGKDKCDIDVIDNGENTFKVFDFENRNAENDSFLLQLIIRAYYTSLL